MNIKTLTFLFDSDEAREDFLAFWSCWGEQQCQDWLECGGWTEMDFKWDPEDPKAIRATTTKVRER